MNIIGCDSIIFIFQSPSRICRSLPRQILERWPTVIVDMLDFDSAIRHLDLTIIDDVVGEIDTYRHTIVDPHSTAVKYSLHTPWC